MTKAKDLEKFRSYVLYGRSGTGKTTLACDFPGPVLLIDIKDQGTDSIMDLDDVDILKVEHWDELELYYWTIKRQIKAGDFEYKTIILDTLSQLQGLCVAKVIEEKNKNVDEENLGRWGIMTRKEWGEVASAMKKWITFYRDLEVETVFIAQDRTFNVGDDADSEVQLDPEVGPQLSPSVMKHLNASVDVIGNTFIREKLVERRLKSGKTIEKEETQFCLRLAPDPVYTTKIRKPKGQKLPKVMVDPSYKKLFNLIKGLD